MYYFSNTEMGAPSLLRELVSCPGLLLRSRRHTERPVLDNAAAAARPTTPAHAGESELGCFALLVGNTCLVQDISAR